MKINSSTISSFIKDFNSAMADLQDKYDVTISLGKVSYDSDEFTTKLSVKNGQNPLEIAKADFDRDVWKYRHLGLEPGMYGRIFLGNDGMRYAVLGFNTRASKYPIHTLQLDSHTKMRCSEHLIREWEDTYYIGNGIEESRDAPGNHAKARDFIDLEQSKSVDPVPPREENLIPKDLINQIKIKTGKSHLKESDWKTITDILFSHDVLTAYPASPNKNIHTIRNVLCQNDGLMVFTTNDSIDRFLQGNHWEMDTKFVVFSIPFVSVTTLARQYGMNIYIDYPVKSGDPYIIYDLKTQAMHVDRPDIK